MSNRAVRASVAALCTPSGLEGEPTCVLQNPEKRNDIGVHLVDHYGRKRMLRISSDYLCVLEQLVVVAVVVVIIVVVVIL